MTRVALVIKCSCFACRMHIPKFRVLIIKLSNNQTNDCCKDITILLYETHKKCVHNQRNTRLLWVISYLTFTYILYSIISTCITCIEFLLKHPPQTTIFYQIIMYDIYLGLGCRLKQSALHKPSH